jgi:alpha-glucoside transport system permease protein
MSVGTAVEAAEARPAKKKQEPAVRLIRRSFSSPVASLLIILLSVLWTVPTFGLLVTSFRPEQQVATTGWWTVFTNPDFTFDNYRTVLFESAFTGGSTGLVPYLVNSLAITIPGVVFPLVVAAMAAYALAWVRFRGSDSIFFLIFALQVVPLQLALIPLLQLYSDGKIGGVTLLPGLQLTGTYWPVWLSHTMFAMPLAVFLLHNFISQLPRDVMEAATMDGADHFKIFRSIVLPLSAPALASFAIFQFLWVWNDLLVNQTFASGGREGPQQVMPLTARLLQLSGSYGSRWHLLTAGAFISILVPLIVFFALQRYFVRGLLAGSVKG